MKIYNLVIINPDNQDTEIDDYYLDFDKAVEDGKYYLKKLYDERASFSIENKGKVDERNIYIFERPYSYYKNTGSYILEIETIG